jgi:hypothetical protein
MIDPFVFACRFSCWRFLSAFRGLGVTRAAHPLMAVTNATSVIVVGALVAAGAGDGRRVLTSGVGVRRWPA